MRLYNLIVFLCMLFLSCKEAMFFEGSGVAVNKISSVTKIDDLFYDFELLPLSVGDSGAFRNADKLVFHKNNYYIMDKSGRRQVLVFDENGNCQRAIGQLGKGRGEYTHIEDFAIDEENNRIVILSYPSTVFVYDMDGSFRFSKRIEKNTLLWAITSCKDGFVCSTNHATYTEGEHAFLFYFFDKDFNFVSKHVPVLPVQMQIPPFVSKLFTDAGNGKLTYFDGYTSSLYTIETADSISIRKDEYLLDNPMPSDIYANPNEFASRQLDFDFFLKGICIEDSLLAFFVEDKKIRGFSAVSGTKAVKAFRYESWLPDLMDYKDGIIYSVINGRNIEANKRLFKGYDLDSLRGLSNDIVLKFRYKGASFCPVR